jgi:hypothetical protein
LAALTGAPAAAAKSPLSGYAWESYPTKQDVYLTPDGHIHELYVTRGIPWSHADLTDLAGAPAAAANSPLSGYAWEAYNSKQVVYLTPDGHVHELYVTPGIPWSHADLTDLAGAPAAAANSPLSAYAWEAYNTKQLVYLTPDGHVHELYVTPGIPWSHADLTDLAGAPAAAANSPLSGYAWETYNSKQVVYLTPDGHVHELYVTIGGGAAASVASGSNRVVPSSFAVQPANKVEPALMGEMPASTVWAITAGPVAPAMPRAPVAPSLARAAADRLFAAWATEDSPLEPLASLAPLDGELLSVTMLART